MSRVTVHDSTRSPPWAEGNGATVRVTSSSRARHIVVAKTRSRAESRAESHAKRAVFTLRAIDMNAEECERCLRAIRAHRPDMKQFLEPELEIEIEELFDRLLKIARKLRDELTSGSGVIRLDLGPGAEDQEPPNLSLQDVDGDGRDDVSFDVEVEQSATLRELHW